MTLTRPHQIHKNMNLREAKRIALFLGARIEPVRRTGEVRFEADGLPDMRTSERRKGAAQPLVSWLRHLAEQVGR